MAKTELVADHLDQKLLQVSLQYVILKVYKHDGTSILDIVLLTNTIIQSYIVNSSHRNKKTLKKG